jgi:hypothetical protein
LAAVFVALMPARRALDFTFFGVARRHAFLRAGLVRALLRFELSLRAATRFFDLAMAFSCDVCRRQADLNASGLCRHSAIEIRSMALRPFTSFAAARAGRRNISMPTFFERRLLYEPRWQQCDRRSF